MGGAWSQLVNGQRRVYHEFDSFSTVVLKPVRSTPGLNVWTPRAAVERRAIPDAPAPKETAKARLLQLGALARRFTAHTVTPEDQRWELRLQSKPMYRYESTNADVLDGAVFAFTSTAGTDCEAIIVIEARRADLAWEWQYAIARLSVFNLYLEHMGREVWSQELGGENTAFHDPERTFDFYFDRVVDEIADGADGGSDNKEP